MSAPLPRRAVVLFNPVAGEGRAAGLAEDAAARLREAGWQAEVVATRAPGDAEPQARQHGPSIDRLVVAGGDGSLREAITGLVAAGEAERVEVAILPCGNANVVARELGVPLDPQRAVECVASPHAVPFDLGRANGEIFLAVASVGWDAQTVRRLSRIRRTRLGGLLYRAWADAVYLLAGVASTFGWPDPFRLEVDGRASATPYRAVVVANLRCYGKGWAMVPDARAGSGRLHYQARKRRGPLFITWQLLAAMLHRRVPGFVSDYADGQKLVLRSDRPFAVQVDGDDRGDAPELRLQVQAAAARFVVPA